MNALKISTSNLFSVKIVRIPVLTRAFDQLIAATVCNSTVSHVPLMPPVMNAFKAPQLLQMPGWKMNVHVMQVTSTYSIQTYVGHVSMGVRSVTSRLHVYSVMRGTTQMRIRYVLNVMRTARPATCRTSTVVLSVSMKTSNFQILKHVTRTAPQELLKTAKIKSAQKIPALKSPYASSLIKNIQVKKYTVLAWLTQPTWIQSIAEDSTLMDRIQSMHKDWCLILRSLLNIGYEQKAIVEALWKSRTQERLFYSDSKKCRLIRQSTVIPTPQDR